MRYRDRNRARQPSECPQLVRMEERGYSEKSRGSRSDCLHHQTPHVRHDINYNKSSGGVDTAVGLISHDTKHERDEYNKSSSDKRRSSAIGAKDEKNPTHQSKSKKETKSQSQSNSSTVQMSTIRSGVGERVFWKIMKKSQEKESRFGIQI